MKLLLSLILPTHPAAMFRPHRENPPPRPLRSYLQRWIRLKVKERRKNHVQERSQEKESQKEVDREGNQEVDLETSREVNQKDKNQRRSL